MTKQPGAKEYFDLHGSYEFKQLLHEYSGNYDSHSDLYSLLEGYPASKQLRTREEVRVNLEAAQNSLDLYETLRENQDDEIQYEVLKGKIELLKWFLKE